MLKRILNVFLILGLLAAGVTAVMIVPGTTTEDGSLTGRGIAIVSGFTVAVILPLVKPTQAKKDRT